MILLSFDVRAPVMRVSHILDGTVGVSESERERQDWAKRYAAVHEVDLKTPRNGQLLAED